ncbi:DUF349 domain-containing protein [Marinifilum sp. N1E240]|jgi:hypothetical protein|uniref:DUF349 domain-containing protein n=1 Tax=Marinifilum sp. N1E240 TaxID=2608082 RepID=UPI00128C14E1|nr:DUF349 domain-containing protein [Marinifilum sp. N1E240]MPQ46308.1 DUF349 domain-containing protein [Marinifilum sp. N1E240]
MKDLSNPSHENELNENLEEKDKTAESHETKNVEEKSIESTESSPKAEIEKVEEINQPEKEEVLVNSAADALVENEEKDSDLQKEPDYTLMEKSELRDRLIFLLENDSLEGVKEKIASIKLNFFKKHNEEVAATKKKFLDDGGKEDEFDFGKDEVEVQVKELFRKYKEKKSEVSRNLEHEKEENLKKKYQIIEDIKDLVNRKEAFDKTFHEFRELQKKWHETGMVPQQALKNLWDNYHHHVENFYDYIKINKELRDLDLKKNMTSKIRLCEEAEKLLNETSAVKAFNTLQKYHEQWREIGPVPRDEKENLWARFKESTTIINKKHQEFYEGLKSEQKVNLEKKAVLCEKAEEIANRKIDSHKDWNATSKEIIDLQKEWRTIGFAPKKDNNRIYQRFRAACDLYFDRKREFYLVLKEKLNENLVKKQELCKTAESLQDSDDWKVTTDRLITIQKQWKTIGPVPRKVSEDLWVRFRAACDKFFNNKSEHFENADSGQVENLKLKEALIEKVTACELSEDNDENLELLRQFQKEWSQIGHVPYKKKDRVQEAFRKAVNGLYDKMNMDSENMEVQKFKSKIDNLLGMSNSEDKIIFERNKIVNKIRQMESDIALWENNVGFFSSSPNSSVVAEIKEKIEKGKQNLNILNQKLKVIDGLVS